MKSPPFAPAMGAYNKMNKMKDLAAPAADV